LNRLSERRSVEMGRRGMKDAETEVSAELIYRSASVCLMCSQCCAVGVLIVCFEKQVESGGVSSTVAVEEEVESCTNESQ